MGRGQSKAALAATSSLASQRRGRGSKALVNLRQQRLDRIVARLRPVLVEMLTGNIEERELSSAIIAELGDKSVIPALIAAARQEENDILAHEQLIALAKLGATDVFDRRLTAYLGRADKVTRNALELQLLAAKHAADEPAPNLEALRSHIEIMRTDREDPELGALAAELLQKVDTILDEEG